MLHVEFLLLLGVEMSASFVREALELFNDDLNGKDSQLLDIGFNYTFPTVHAPTVG